MGRRRSSGLEDLIAIVAALPWWIGLGLAAVSFLLLRAVAGAEAPAATELTGIGPTAFWTAAIAFAKVGQWAVPMLFVFAAALGFVRQAKARRLVDGFGSGDARSPLTWREFEALVGEIYRQQGYRVAETPGGPDGGVDIVFSRGDERFLVQCKHWQARLVDVKVVRELKGVIAATGAVGGAVVTSGDFTRDAIEFAEKARVDVIDGRRLQALARQLGGGESNDQLTAAVSRRRESAGSAQDKPECPQCGSGMVLRAAKRGPNAGRNFWGCLTYPKCKGTRQAEA
jgi:restriction system protein